MKIILALLLLCTNCFTDEKIETTDLAYETITDNRLLIFSLLDGSFVAVDRSTGDILWKHSSKAPIVSVPTPTSTAIQPLYIPDPRDGSIYLLSSDYNLPSQPMRKLPFTIPELVAASPCKSSDSILYTGSKRDSWLRLDRRTGEMREILGWEDNGESKGSTCPVDSASGRFQVYLGRTQYTVLMIDSRNESRRWNVSFSQYNAPPMSPDDLSSYEHLHLTSSSSGHVMTVDRRTGAFVWRTKDIGAPVVGAYLLDELVGGLLQVPFTSASAHTLKTISERGASAGEDDDGGAQVWAEVLTQQKLYPTLYLGLHDGGGLYALPSLLERPGLSISDIGGLPLTTNGPVDADGPIMLMHTFGDSKNEGRALYLGHYHVPDYVPDQYPLQVLHPSDSGKNKQATAGYITHVVHHKNPPMLQTFDKSTQSDTIVPPPLLPSPPLPEILEDNVMNYYDHLTVGNLIRHIYTETKQWLDGQENKAIKLTLIVLVGCVVAMVWYVRMQVQEMRQISQNGSSNSKQQQYLGDTVGIDGATISITELLDNGHVRVGKIQFNPNNLLGKGCEGTFVYRGSFDGRQVAVKRLLPECFSLADREVTLLRESDAHAHVIRYYCTEQDRLFRYIALELCEATLHDYVTGKWKPIGNTFTADIVTKADATDSTAVDLIRQVILGVEHLHSLNIVHRDIKPQNVLLMVVPPGVLRAMISDFGLCKKVAEGHVSFSRRSGITGTDGWMAPEMFQQILPELPNNRPTLAVDQFSIGCLIYYVLTWGGHPFGEPLHRQANIQSNRYHLNAPQLPNWPLWRHLVMSLLRPKHESQLRPPCHVILHHPALWPPGKVLEFLQDVSDCVERRCRRDTDLAGGTDSKATLYDLIYVNQGIIRDDPSSWWEQLEQFVVRGDWRAHVDGVVVEDLRKYRTYQGTNVRDLLRAIRNKRNHYRELSVQAQCTLGAPSVAFTQYWTGRFPQLVLYTWLALQHAVSDASNDTSVRSHYANSNRVEYFPLNREVVRNGTMQIHVTDMDRQLVDKYHAQEEEERLMKEQEQQNKKREQCGGTPRRRYYHKRSPQQTAAHAAVVEINNDNGGDLNWRSRPSQMSNSHNNNVS